MVFSSFLFIFGFLPVALLGFWGISKFGPELAKFWLCLVSIVFYGWWHAAWIPILLFSIFFNYMIGWLLIKRPFDGKFSGAVVVFGITANLLALFYYKYLFAILSFFHLDTSLAAKGGLPLGISFFTFTQIAFLIDISQGFAERYNPINYLLFVTFFPHLIAGPIVHHRDLMPQFEEKKNYEFQPAEFAVGLSIFSIGLAKKTMIADTAGELAKRLLGAGHVSPGFAWLGAIAYSMQLYFDFSGYSDMAIGLARLFGIKFPINFDSPYKATSIIEFWQRWHITLTRFLTAYIYNPIALALVRRRAAAGLSNSKRVSKTLRGFLELIALPTLITMLLAGIWHGAGLQFIIFGGLHGVYLSINHAWRTFGPKSLQAVDGASARVYAIACTALVYLGVLVAQIFFRAESVGGAFAVLSDMLALPGTTDAFSGAHLALNGVHHSAVVKPPIYTKDLLFMAGAMAIAWLAPNTQQIMANHDPVLNLGRRIDGSSFRVNFTLGWSLALGVVFFLGLINIHDGQPFIYFQF